MGQVVWAAGLNRDDALPRAAQRRWVAKSPKVVVHEKLAVPTSAPASSEEAPSIPPAAAQASKQAVQPPNPNRRRFQSPLLNLNEVL